MNNVFNTFDNRVNAPEPHIVALLAEIDEAKGHFRAGLRMTPQAMTNLKKSTLVTSAGASTRIEGARLDDTEVENILRGLATSHFADRDSQEVQGYLGTLQHVFESYEPLPLRESVVLSLHNQLLKYSVKDSSHRRVYKKKENDTTVEKELKGKHERTKDKNETLKGSNSGRQRTNRSRKTTEGTSGLSRETHIISVK